jgi:hypothetical protein
MDKSQLRKQLLESQEEVASLLQLFMQRPALIRGSVYKLRRKCGKATCRCQEGHLHESWVLSVPEKGRKRMRTVPKGKRLKWQQMADNYRYFRRARTRLIKLFAEILKLVDELERERTVPPPLSEGARDASNPDL